MEQLVDSNSKKLGLEEIVKIAAANTKSEYSFNQVFMSIMKELTLKGSIVIQIGNTIYVMHRASKNPYYAVMRALNADTAQNYLTNSEQFAKMAYDKYNVDVIVSQYTDPTLNKIFEYVGRNKPANMGFNIVKAKDGKSFLATAKLGPPRGETQPKGNI